MRSIGKTDKGKKRSMNQDTFFISDMPVGILPNLYIVADGMGGQNAGDVASRFCVERFTELVRVSKERTPIQVIEKAVRETNEDLIAKAKTQKELEGMGTTFVLATLMPEGYLLVANIGDSRMYLIDGHKITQISQDHSLVAEMVRNGELSREEARFHPNKNVILRAMSTQGVVSPDYYQVAVKPGDYALLCSDGLTDMVEEAELLKMVSEYDDVGDIAERMINTANENGGRDNITLVLLKI
ncbi:MAG: Stp1/IreP family PP2C-type Ser/Thr phosphatase [Lachnospiraceae bacterium]|nr:Stp1/IreP family PP2C-type Ser/Thr phosphatase [Lachnospiraceae bacterium]